MGDSREAKRVANRLALMNTGFDLPFDLDLSRRDMLKIAGYGSLAAFIAACGGTSTSGNSGSITATGGKMSLGSYGSDPGSKAGVQAIADAFTAANGGTKVTVNTVDHGTFQNQITHVPRGHARGRLHLVLRTSHAVLRRQGPRHADRRRLGRGEVQLHAPASPSSVKGNDGHVYAMPTDYYPWAVFYRKDVLAAKGYTVPTNWDDFKALCDEDEDGRPDPDRFRRQGRLAGAGHVRHPQPAPERLRLPRQPADRANGQKWTDPKVTAVFKKWSQITQYYSPAFAGLTWEQGADQLLRKTGRHVPARTVRLRRVQGERQPGRPRPARLLPVPGRSAPRTTPRRRSTRRSTSTWSARSRRP